MLIGIKTVKSTGGKTNDKDMNAAKMVVTGNPKMTMSKNDSTPTTLVVQWCEAAVIVGPEGGIIKDLELSTGARIKVETGKVKYKGTRIVALLIAQVKGGNQWSDGSGNFLKTKFLNEIMNEIKLVIGRDHYHYRKDVESILPLWPRRGEEREAKSCSDLSRRLSPNCDTASELRLWIICV